MTSPFSRTTSALARDSSDSTLIALAVASACIFLWLLWFLLSRVTVYEVSRGARLEAGSAPWLLTASVPGKVVRSRLVIGKAVRAGDVLVELDAAAQRLLVAEEAARLQSLDGKAAALRREIAALDAAWQSDRKSAEAASATAEARVAEAAAGLEFATDNQARMEAQSTIGGVAEIDSRRARADALKLKGTRDALLAEARRARLEAMTRAQQSSAQIDALRGELAGLEGEIAAKRAAVDRARNGADALVIRAPVDGVVGEAMAVRPGTLVSSGTRLATVIPDSRLVIVATFDPAATLGRVRPGQVARMDLDGFPWTQFGSVEARVVRVASETRNSLLRVELVPSARDTGSLVLRHGLTGRVEVGVEQVSPLTLMLRSAGMMMGR